MDFWEQVLVGVTLAALAIWVGWRWLVRSREDSGWLLTKWVLTAILFPGAVLAVLWGGVFGMPILVICSIVMGCLWAPTIGMLVARPLTSLYEGGHMDLRPEPRYSVAEARRKHGDYEAALEELRGQLGTFPEHFEVQLRMAEIEANDLRDLGAAEQTIERILAQPGHTAGEVAIALNSLAEWRLRLAHDREGARAALERVIERFPDSEQARMAEQRLAHLPSAEMLAASWDRPGVALPAGESRVGLRTAPLEIAPKEEAPGEVAARLVRQLEVHPHDLEAREQLATLYADHFGRLDLALEQLEQLIEDPRNPARQVIHWLNLEADLHMRLNGDVAAAGAALDRVIERFPNAAGAETARNRKARLRLELKARAGSQVVKLGSYEEIGIRARRR